MRQSRIPALVLAVACFVSPTVTSLSAQITAAEYQHRRDSLAARIGSGVVLAFGGRTPVSDNGPFRQLPAFRYLTGYEHADAALVMIVRDGRGTSTLFVHRSAPRRSLYYGSEPDSTAIARELGLASRPADHLARVADSLAALGMAFNTLRDFAATDFARADSLTRGRAFVDALAERHPGLVVSDAHPIVDRLRARKSEAELLLIRKAAEISAEGHRELMRRIAVNMHEYDLQAIIEAAFLHLGAEGPAYGSIVGSGPNGTVLHYMRNRRALEPGELVVIDAGAEYHGYAADITRTLPVSGTFTGDQRALYQIVLDALEEAERYSGPGMSLQGAYRASLDVRAEGLARLGLIESPDALFDPPWPADCARFPQSCRQVMLFAIHGITHGIGLEVHDPLQAYQGTFQVGDAFTIEPGVYVSLRQLEILPDTPRNRRFVESVRAAVERYQGSGVRIEDDYVITEQGLERITDVPREIDEIEALTRRRVPLP